MVNPVDSGPRALGARAERLAAEWFLARFPSRLIARNFRCRGGELDLIFEAPPDLVFVEVRARLPGAWQDGIASVGWGKRQRLRRAIERFLLDYRGPSRGIRVDILAWNGRDWTHLRNARMDC
jgi:putative endonuclease